MHLQALVHAPVGVVKDRGHEWVPLCLSYLSAKQPVTQSEELTDAADQGAEPVTTETAPPASSAIDTSAAESREDAWDHPGNARIGARYALQFLSLLQILCRLHRGCVVYLLPSARWSRVTHAVPDEGCGEAWPRTGWRSWQA